MFDIFFVQQLVNGLSVGFIYALMAIGFTLIFGVLNVVNFAHVSGNASAFYFWKFFC